MKKSCVSLISGVALLILLPNLAQANSGDFSGSVAVGSSYAGVSTAPANGLIVQGNVGIGTSAPLGGTALTVNGAINANSLMLNGSQMPLPLGGRLTLSSNTPIMTTDVTAATTIYYTDYLSDVVPIYNGTNWIEYALGGQLSLALDSNSAHTGYQQSGKLFDLIIRNNSGSPQLCTGPAWTSNVARASSIALQNGIWTNSGSWTVKCDATSSTLTCTTNQCTYVGTMYATANGQTQMNFIPTAVAGGTNNIVGLYNAYNHVRLASVETDDTVTWSYTTAAFRSCDNSTNNRISFVDGLGQNFIVSPLRGNATIGTGGAAMSESMDSTSAGGGTGVSGNFFFQPSSGTFTASGEMTSYWNPVLGFHYIQCLEFGGPSDVFVGQFRLVMSVEMDD